MTLELDMDEADILRLKNCAAKKNLNVVDFVWDTIIKRSLTK